MNLRKLLCTVVILSVLLVFVSPAKSEGTQSFPEVWTDEPDYFPGETALLIGSGFKPSSQVMVSVTKPDLSVDTFSADTDGEGCFSCYYGPIWTEGEYFVKATDGVNIAETTFTDCYVLIRMYYSADHKPFSKEVDCRGYDYVFNPSENAYISFYGLECWKDYKVEFWAKKGTELISSMTVTFNSGGSTSYNLTVQIPPSGPVSTNGQYWLIKIYRKHYSGWSLVSCGEFWVASLKLYKDASHTKPSSTFLPGEAVYIVGEGFKPNKTVKISYYYKSDSNVVKMFGPYTEVTNSIGTFTTSFTCVGPQGEWIILARWSTWCWCPSIHYKTESFFVVPELPFGTLAAVVATFLAYVTKARKAPLD